MSEQDKQQSPVLGDFNPQFTVHRDPKTKQVIKINPYKLIAHKGKSYYEWPVHSGNLWWADRTAAGRMESGEIIEGASHKTYIPPVTEEMTLNKQVNMLEQEKTRLIKELEEIKREQKYADKGKDVEKKSTLSDTIKNTKEK